MHVSNILKFFDVVYMQIFYLFLLCTHNFSPVQIVSIDIDSTQSYNRRSINVTLIFKILC